MAHLQSYGVRSAKFDNISAKRLLQTIERKKSNLAVGVDVTKSDEVLAIIDAIGPFVCIVKVFFLAMERLGHTHFRVTRPTSTSSKTLTAPFLTV
jgi:orotidine-5'-phosphate decarboxylase